MWRSLLALPRLAETRASAAVERGMRVSRLFRRRRPHVCVSALRTGAYGALLFCCHSACRPPGSQRATEPAQGAADRSPSFPCTKTLALPYKSGRCTLAAVVHLTVHPSPQPI